MENEFAWNCDNDAGQVLGVSWGFCRLPRGGGEGRSMLPALPRKSLYGYNVFRGTKNGVHLRLLEDMKLDLAVFPKEKYRFSMLRTLDMTSIHSGSICDRLLQIGGELAQVKEFGVDFEKFGRENARKSNADGAGVGQRRCSEDLVH
jgi:hypothetical protein